MYKKDNPFIQRIIELASQKDNILIDGFCGLGGVTEGFEQADNFYVIACINHWDEAIRCHQSNHPNCLHLLEDFRTADISLIVYMVDQIRLRNPNIKVHIWLSLECTNFSIAKGGLPRDADSRTLAEHADRYVVELDPDVLWIENVKEFMSWGPMISKTKVSPEGHQYSPLVVDKKKKVLGPWMIPDPVHKGEDFKAWCKHIQSFGYDCYHKLINMADFGVPQHRVRLIMQFPKNGVPAIYPLPTHAKGGKNGLPNWLPVRDCLDLDDEGDSVIKYRTNKAGVIMPRIRSGKTIDRLIAGCKKHVLKGRNTFMAQAYTGKDDDKVQSVDNPSRAITGTGGNLFKVDAKTVSDQWVVKPNSASNNTTVSSGASLNESAPTLTCFNGLNLATTKMLSLYYGQGGTDASIEDPCPVIPTKDRVIVNTVKYIDQYYSGGDQHRSIDEPSSSTTGVPKQRVVDVTNIIIDTQFGNDCHGLDQPSRTQTANRKHFYLVNFQWMNGFLSIEKPSNTIIARMDKAPQYLIVTEEGDLAIEVYDHEPEHIVRLKQFMAANGILDIKMRMLNKRELKRIMTIPVDYNLTGTDTDQKKMIGNAVPSHFVTELANAYDRKTRETKMAVA